jgi:ABC-type phosphate transport system permease subunit
MVEYKQNSEVGVMFYSVAFNITTIPLFGLYFTILFILWHSTLLQHLFFVSKQNSEVETKKGIVVMLNGTE